MARSRELPRIPQKRLAAALSRINSASTVNDKGRALEDFACFLFPQIPGVEIAEKNAVNAFQTEEVDVALWNARHGRGLYFLPNLLLIEAKNWSSPCGSQEVAYFVSRLQHRGCDHGILLATNGITGVAADLSQAHFEIATALSDGIRVLVITLGEIQSVASSDEIVTLLKRKLCQLVVSGTTIP